MDRKKIIIGTGIAIVILVLTIAGVFYFTRQNKKTESKTATDVLTPTIIDGELVLPKLDLSLKRTATGSGATSLLDNQIMVISANLVGTYSQAPSASEGGQLTGIRIMGEMFNPGQTRITSFLPVVRFLDSEGNLKTQKIAHYSDGYELYGLDGQTKGVYDVTVDAPPPAERIEIVLKPQDGDKALRPPVALKVASRSAEIKSISMNGQPIDYYSITGEVINTTDSDVADILVNTYVKDKEGKVFGINKELFKSDLIRPGETIPFKVMVLPIQSNAVYSDFVVEVWGREYKL